MILDIILEYYFRVRRSDEVSSTHPQKLKTR